MAMTDGRVPRFGALVREALAVLAAILVAFALDAWWDERKEQEAMYEALETVALEVERNLDLIDETIGYNQGQVRLARRALSMSLEELDEMTTEELLSFQGMPNYNLITFELGAITAFIEGGFLPVMDDLDLRVLLAGLPRLQIELDEEGNVMQRTMARFTPRLTAAMPDEVLNDPLEMVGESGTRATVAAVIEDRGAREAFVERTFVLSFLYGEELSQTREQLVIARDRLNETITAR